MALSRLWCLISVAFLTSLHVLWTTCANVVVHALDIAFPATSARPPAEVFSLIGASADLTSRQSAKVLSFEQRRLQRNPLDMSVGCGLRLAA